MADESLLESIVGATAASILGAVGTVAGAVAGFGPVKEWLNGCKTRLVAGRSTPGNHDLVKGIRTAHLCALDYVARSHTTLLATLPSHEIGPDDHAFATNLRAFLDKRLKLISDEGIDHDVLTVDDINHVLEQVVHAAAHESFAELSRKARADCERRALDELTHDAGRKVPALFERVFRGELVGADSASWYEAFSLFVTEELKTNERFRSIFFSTQLVDIRRAIDAIDALINDKFKRFPDLSGFTADVKQQLYRLARGVDEANTKLDQQTQLLQKLAAHLGMREGGPFLDAKVTDLEAELHATRTDLIALLVDIVGQGINPDQIDGALRAAKENLEKSRAELDRLHCLTNEAPEIEADLAAARVALNNPPGIDLADAERAISAARARYRTTIVARRGVEAINVARMMEAEASICLARSDSLRAASLLAEAAKELPASERALAAEFRFRQGDALREHGSRFTGLSSLRDAVTAYRAALTAYTAQDMPAAWAMTQNNLGIALMTLGEREGGAGGLSSLRDAVTAFRAALTAYTEQDMPADWAATQNNLGAALKTLGEREGGAGGLSSLRDAVTAFRAALTAYTKQDMPADWAATQNNRGTALRTLGEREGGAGGLSSLRDAVTAFRAALTVYTEQDMPVGCAMTQNNLGNALGEREGGAGGLSSLRDAVTAFWAALTVYAERDMPAAWAATQNNLGAALGTLGEREGGAGGLSSLRDAEAAFRAALTVYTEQDMPAAWAMTKKSSNHHKLKLANAVYSIRFGRCSDLGIIYDISHRILRNAMAFAAIF